MVDTVLIPIDGSAASRRAVEFGSDLAVRYRARLIILHVLLRQNLAEAMRGLTEVERSGGLDAGALAKSLGDIPLKDLLGVRADPFSAPQEVLDAIATKVIEYAERLARSKGLSDVKSVIEDGDPVRRILELADQENVDVIVMGARGLSDVEALLLGSVSRSVSHLARCTCITVR